MGIYPCNGSSKRTIIVRIYYVQPNNMVSDIELFKATVMQTHMEIILMESRKYSHQS